MTTVLVTGAAGLVGSFVAASAPEDVDLVAATRHDADLSDPAATAALFERVRPDLVVHAAYSMRKLQADGIDASRHVVDGCVAHGAALIALSTDALFDGEHAPYAEDDPPSPVHAYGRAKAAMEADVAARLPAATIVRTSLVCAVDPPDPRTAWVLDGLLSGEPPTLFTDELRNPVRADDLAAALWSLAAMDPPARAGVWHVVGAEPFSRYDLGALVAEWAGLDPSALIAAESAATPGPEPRPRDCRLTTARTDAAGIRCRSVRTLFVR